jgi:hypothetical protein
MPSSGSVIVILLPAIGHIMKMLSTGLGNGGVLGPWGEQAAQASDFAQQSEEPLGLSRIDGFGRVDRTWAGARPRPGCCLHHEDSTKMDSQARRQTSNNHTRFSTRQTQALLRAS